MPFTKDLRPTIKPRYNQALNLLQISERARITRPGLDIERLLGRAPDLAAAGSPAPAAVRHGNQR